MRDLLNRSGIGIAGFGRIRALACKEALPMKSIVLRIRRSQAVSSRAGTDPYYAYAALYCTYVVL
jgi:hypothetical protein